MVGPGVAERSAVIVAAASLTLCASLMLYEAGRPLQTDDFWWHLKMGEIFATEGLWPASDPLLHTAPAGVPPQHEWLFDVTIHVLGSALGLHGLRAIHALTVAGILALVTLLCWREGRCAALACAATSVFVLLAWWRLFQFRPDLLSILATLALYGLLLSSEKPARTRLVAALAVLLIWANAHSLFAIGLLLLAAALVGQGLRALLVRWAGSRGTPLVGLASAGPRARRLGIALVLGILVTLANPRGAAQHLSFFISSTESVIWNLQDDWTPFDPFHFGHYGQAVSLPMWIAADGLLAVFALCALLGLARFARRPSSAALDAVDPVRLALGVAGTVALLVSIRFLWMGIFPLLFVLHTARAASERPLVARLTTLVAAATSLSVALAFPTAIEFRAEQALRPTALAAYFVRPYDGFQYHADGVRFLSETGLRGNLFNTYGMGGFLGYWLAPRLKTFVDGRMNFPPEVFSEYRLVNIQRGHQPGESFLDVLDRRGVDVFFGVGVPMGRARTDGRLYTTANLEGVPGWLLVSRSMRHAIYLRDDARNRANLRRISIYYRLQDVPFDPETGLDVGKVIRERPEWAIRRGMLPAEYTELQRDRHDADPAVRVAALERLGLALALSGAYAEQAELEREAIAASPDARPPRRRLIYALLRLGRPEEAVAATRELLAIDPADPRSLAFAEVARKVQARSGGQRDGAAIARSSAPINSLVLVTERDLW